MSGRLDGHSHPRTGTRAAFPHRSGQEPTAVKVIKSSVVDCESRLRVAQEIEVLKRIWGPRIAAFGGPTPMRLIRWANGRKIAGDFNT